MGVISFALPEWDAFMVEFPFWHNRAVASRGSKRFERQHPKRRRTRLSQPSRELLSERAWWTGKRFERPASLRRIQLLSKWRSYASRSSAAGRQSADLLCVRHLRLFTRADVVHLLDSWMRNSLYDGRINADEQHSDYQFPAVAYGDDAIHLSLDGNGIHAINHKRG